MPSGDCHRNRRQNRHGCIFVYISAIFAERNKVVCDINEWNSLEKTFTYLPSAEEMGEYSDLQSKHLHKEYFIFRSDAYILKVTCSKEMFDKQKMPF